MRKKWETCPWQAVSGQWHDIRLSASASSPNSSHSSVNTCDSACCILTSVREIFFQRSVITSACKLDLVCPNDMRTLFFRAATAVFWLGELEFLSTDRRGCVFFPWELCPFEACLAWSTCFFLLVAGFIDSLIYHSARAIQKKIELGKTT